MVNPQKFETMQTELMKSLQTACKTNSIDVIVKKISSINAPDADKKIALDHVFREFLLGLIQKTTNAKVAIYENYIELCIKACRQDLCSATMPVVLLGDVFDSLTLDRCELLFAFVEKGVNVWKEPCFFGACKNNLLRMCNDLLRRLSRSQNTVFCGRILLFLAKFFPFSERSGLNVVSEFNLDNVTEYGADVGKELDDLEPKQDETKSDIKIKIDYNLYCKFWALQDFFRNPNQCYNKLQWRVFTSHASDVLSAFNSFKLEDVQKFRNKDATDCKTNQDNSTSVQQYFAKYLTNQKLLDLQLSDSNFRRYVLLQFLIVFQYLGSSVKFRPDSDELKPEQMDWVGDTTKLVYTLLEETPPRGKEFAKSVLHILKREEHWNKWKNDGCPEFGKTKAAPSPAPATKPTRKRIGDLMRQAHVHKKFVMGTMELTKLWNISSNNLDACRSKERNFLPSLECYFEEAIQQTDPSNMIEEGYKRVNDGSFGWRALRLMARRSPHFFTHSNNPINKLPEYLEMMIKRIAKDLPQSAESQDEAGNRQSDVVMEEDQPVQDAEEEELLHEEERKDTENAGIDSGDAEESEPQRAKSTLTDEMIDAVASKLGSEWTRLAIKLGYKDDEIEYCNSQYNNDTERAKHLLRLWSQDDEDASIPSLNYTLTGLALTDAAEALMSCV